MIRLPRLTAGRRRAALAAVALTASLGALLGASALRQPNDRSAFAPVNGSKPAEPVVSPAPPTPSPMLGALVGMGVVSNIVDGDTVDVLDDTGRRVRVRVLGIDTPETKDPDQPVQCWGLEATAFAERTLLERRVALYTDPTQADRDRYGRLLAYVVLVDSQANYSVLAAAAGAARSYVFDGRPVTLHAEIAAAEDRARAAGIGLWGPPCNGVVNASASPAETSGPGADAVYYPNCAAVRAAGKAPLHAGEPGYRVGLDGDRDGVACESSR